MDDAADAILGRWTDPDEDQVSKDALEATEEEVDETDDTSDEEEDDTTEEVEADPDEDEAQEEEEVEPVAALSDETMIDIQIDGETKQASVKDLKRLYGQEASLTRKSQETAATRKVADEAIQKADANYQKMLERAETRWKPYSEVDMMIAAKQMSNEDFAALRNEAKVAEEDLKFLKEESNKFYEDMKAQQTTQMQSAAKECIKVLSAEVPDWSNDLYNDIRSYATTQGLPAEQVDTIVDPNVIQILNKARLYDAGKKVAATKKAAKAPVKVLRSKKSPTNINEGKTRRQTAAMKALNDSSGLSGDLDAIADVLMNRWET
jgi:hypothetical protein